ncbi:MAG: glycosyltransferase family A protein [Cellvibrionaceae bacterium]
MLSYFLKKVLRRHDEKNNLKLKALMRETMLESLSLTSSDIGIGNDKEHSIIVSLTSFEKRIDNLYICIESLFQQSLKADKIILWLSKKNFLEKALPENLLRLQSRGLSIKWVDDDIGPYKKIIYSLRAFPESIIVTVDDDVMYPADTVDLLYQSYLKNPQFIHCNRAFLMKKRGRVFSKYSSWMLANNNLKPRYDVFPTGIAGVLYPPGSLDKEVNNQKIFMDLCPNADDVWLKAMSLKAGVKVIKVNDERPWKGRFLIVSDTQSNSLKKINWKKIGGNDEKIKAVFDYYQLYDFPEKN